MKRWVLGTILLLSISSMAPAVQITYEGVLPFDGFVTGEVGGSSWFDEDGSQTDFWSFFGTVGDVVDIWAIRLDQSLDPAMSLYLGTTTADESEFRNGLLLDGNFGGLTFLASADDEISPPGNTGPFADPLFQSFTLPETGDYSIAIGGFASDGLGLFPYALLYDEAGSAPNSIPLPGALMLLGSAIVALVGFARGRGGAG